MFGRRKRSSSHHQPLSTPASQSAHSAANHAFLKSQQSSSSLSSAAAAAALRNLTPTPTQVENVQTKRMVQRASSVHSNSPNVSRRLSAGSSHFAGGSLRRASSSGSMSARTFRESSPSPHRPITSSGAVHTTPVDVPPLPNMPSIYQSRKLPGRRTSSLQPTLRSPPASPISLRVATGRGASVDRGREGKSAASSPTHNRFNSLGTVSEQDRPGSRNSVNFSYPRGSRPISPTLAENRPVKVGSASARGDHSKATKGNQPFSEKPTSPKSKKTEHRKESHVTGSVAPTAAAAVALGATQRSSSPKNLSHAKKPERLDQKSALSDPMPLTTSPSAEKDSLTTRPSTVFEESEQPETNGNVDTHAHENRLTTSTPTTDHLEVSTPQSSPSNRQEEEHIRQSSSPGRNARFSKWLSISGDGDQIHQPPPRSFSPAKSALKHPRGASTSPERKTDAVSRGVQLSSELSDGTSVASDEGSRLGAKKRAAKVSFDEEAEIVGVAASPPTSPEEYIPENSANNSKSRKGWLGIGKRRSSALEFSTGDEEFDKVLKPRPVLPSFGSVRGNRDGVPQPSEMPQFSDNESTASSSDYDESAPEISFTGHDIFPLNQEKGTSQVHNFKTVEDASINGPLTYPPKTPSSKKSPEQPPLPEPDSYMSVPSIAVEPATPPIETDQSHDQRSSFEVYSVPGGFPPLKSSGNTSAVVVENQDLEDDTDDSDASSVYSDAAEDLDGHGFGSINAIVDSRPIHNSSAPVNSQSESRDTTPRPLNRTAASENEFKAVTDQDLENIRSSTPASSSVDHQPEQSPAFSDSIGPVNGAVSSRAEMPSQSQPRASPVQNEPKVLNSSKKPNALFVDTSPNAGQDKRRSKALGPAFQRTYSPPLARSISNGSDSSSSFKRTKASSRGTHGMLRTMRASPTSPTHPRVNSTMSNRSDSPDFRPRSAGSSGMRKTLRSPAPGGERASLRANKKTSRAGPTSLLRPIQKSRFEDSDGEEDEPRPIVYSSRFADSSDEDEPVKTPMRPVRGIPRRQGALDGDSTELEDSSEDDDGRKPGLVNLKKFARTTPGSRDSNSAPNMSGMSAVARQRGMTQRQLDEFLMTPPGGRKQGLFSRLGLKKPANKDHRVYKSDVESPSRRDTPLERSRLERERLRGASFVDDSYPNTTTTVTSGPGSPKRLKKPQNRPTPDTESWPLQDGKREAPEPKPEQKIQSPASPIQIQKPEPATNPRRASVDRDGPMRGTTVQRSDDVTSVTSNENNNPSARDVVIGGSGRKKRFPKLRKAFNLKGWEF